MTKPHRLVVEVPEDEIARIDEVRRRAAGRGVPSRAAIVREALAAFCASRMGVEASGSRGVPFVVAGPKVLA